MNQHTGCSCDRNKDLILKMMAEDQRISHIAKVVGTDQGAVHNFLKRQGIDRPFPRRFQGNRNPHWGGGRVIDKHGYILLHCPTHPFCNRSGYVREHRLVMEKMIGRYLSPKEVVHHKNRIRDDNSEGNLELFRTNSDHLRHELKGKVPKWTPETLEQQNKWLAQGREILRQKSLQRSKQSASENTQTEICLKESPPLDPLLREQMEYLQALGQPKSSPLEPYQIRLIQQWSETPR